MTTSGFDVKDLAYSYRRLVLWFGSQLLVNFTSMAMLISLGEEGIAILVSLLLVVGSLVILAALIYYAARTAIAMGSDVGWVWGVAMLMPMLNVITLLVLSARATRACRANGVRVGFFGPKIPQVPSAPESGITPE